MATGRRRHGRPRTKKHAANFALSGFCCIFAAIMEYNTLTLPNGLRIIHLPSASPVVYCGYCIAAGTRDEGPGQEGMAHFCEHTTFKGTARRRS